MFGFKNLNIGKKEQVEIKLWKCLIKNFPQTFLISIESKNKYGASEETLKYILHLFFSNYLIFAKSLFSSNIQKKGFNKYYFDNENYNAIFDQAELHNIFCNPKIAEHFYFVEIEYKNIDETIYQKSKKYIDFIEGNIKADSADIKVLFSEVVWSDLSIIYTSMDRYIKDIKDLLPNLFRYLNDNNLLY